MHARVISLAHCANPGSCYRFMLQGGKVETQRGSCQEEEEEDEEENEMVVVETRVVF